MNENKDYNSENITPYKATANLNTAIANPNVNINDTMNINIKTMATNIPSVNTEPVNTDNNCVKSHINNTEQIKNVVNSKVAENQQNNVSGNHNPNVNIKTNESTDNKNKKKNILLNIKPELKIALLIIVILLACVLILPILSDLIIG